MGHLNAYQWNKSETGVQANMYSMYKYTSPAPDLRTETIFYFTIENNEIMRNSEFNKQRYMTSNKRTSSYLEKLAATFKFTKIYTGT